MEAIRLYEEAQSRLVTVHQREKEERPDVEDLTPNAAGRAPFEKSQAAVSHQVAPSERAAGQAVRSKPSDSTATDATKYAQK